MTPEEFVRRGLAAQRAVDRVIGAARQGRPTLAPAGVKPDEFWLLSSRMTPEITSIWAVVVKLGGVEGVVRRETASGTMAWQTDDPELAKLLLHEARRASGYQDAYLVRFDRAVTEEGI